MALQNIDTQALGQLISAFRALQTKDSISPESLGSLLQSIASLVASAPTLASAQQLEAWAEALKGAKSALFSVSQGLPDRNDLNLNVSNVNLASGSTSMITAPVVIRQATIDRAGVMRAEHVTQLYAATRNITALQEAVAAANAVLADIDAHTAASQARFALTAEGGRLRIRGAERLIEAGYVPYVFRCLTKRNSYNLAGKTEQEKADHGRPPKRKGWAVFGSMYSVKIEDGTVMFSTARHNLHSNMEIATAGYSHLPDTFVTVATRQNGDICVRWGCQSILLHNPTSGHPYYRRLKLRFALGFAPPFLPGCRRITPADLVTELVEFSIVYNPSETTGDTPGWRFAHP